MEAANPIQVLLLTNQTILISEIDEVLAEICQPDCKLINPCVIINGKVSKWMSDLTPNKEMFMSSDKILTLVDPSQNILAEYKKIIQRGFIQMSIKGLMKFLSVDMKMASILLREKRFIPLFMYLRRKNQSIKLSKERV